ncbi:three-helix bundle dimerization domain-containing protein [Actinokineospora sp. HUAS TT18]|uniref:three-helix bundle dimerization domain-containing protein n=1 Tax=Actinokineospora sp. HUAS TT18 TaxID=3447451 RepID=UPI003F527D66
MPGLPDPSTEEVQHELDRITDHLAERFDTERVVVHRYVLDSYNQLAEGATVRAHLLALTEHAVRDRLSQRSP